jgi:hypothetical protein
VLAEAEWPEALQLREAEASEVAVARERLLFFAHLGAKLIDIAYVQPALGVGQLPVSQLALLLIPSAETAAAAHDDDALGKSLARFLEEFYRALSLCSRVPIDVSTLEELRGQCGARRPLTSHLPRLRESDAALCFHFVELLDPSDASNAGLHGLRSYACPVLHSLESDLLSRAYRKSQPLRSVCVTRPLPSASGEEAGVPVEICFPEFVSYEAENRVEQRHWTLRRRQARAYLSFTALFEANALVWHLVLRSTRCRTDNLTRPHWRSG